MVILLYDPYHLRISGGDAIHASHNRLREHCDTRMVSIVPTDGHHSILFVTHHVSVSEADHILQAYLEALHKNRYAGTNNVLA
jgi:hypothetical protein